MKRIWKRLAWIRWSRLDVVLAAGGGAAAYGIGWMFYQHPLIPLLLVPGGWFVVPLVRSVLERRRYALQQLEFSRFLQALISALYAGHSLESAFREIEGDLRREHVQERSGLLAMLTKVNQRVMLGEPLERALADTAELWVTEDWALFTETLAVYRRNGGNLLLHLRKTAELIAAKIQADQDVQVIMAQKQTEGIMMNLAPYAMVGLILIGSPEYAAPLYSGSGRLVITCALALILAGHIWTFFLLRRKRL